MKKYMYTGKKPRNISYKGVSFPIYQNDVVMAYPGFLDHYIPKREFRETNKPVAPKYSFKQRVGLFSSPPRPNMPVTSSSTPQKRAKPPVAVTKDLLIEDSVSLSTNPETPTKDSLISEEKLQVSSDVEEDLGIEEDDLDLDDTSEDEDIDLEESSFEEEVNLDDEGEEEEAASMVEVEIPNKTSLRQDNKPDLFTRIQTIVEEGAPLKKDMLEDLSGVSSDDHRGRMFDLLWQYYGYDEE